MSRQSKNSSKRAEKETVRWEHDDKGTRTVRRRGRRMPWGLPPKKKELK